MSRTAHRNNTSNYYINDRKCGVAEVMDLLKGKGIDLDNNRFLILQASLHNSAGNSITMSTNLTL